MRIKSILGTILGTFLKDSGPQFIHSFRNKIHTLILALNINVDLDLDFDFDLDLDLDPDLDLDLDLVFGFNHGLARLTTILFFI